MARRLLVMAHYKLSPKSVQELTEPEIAAMEMAYLLLERRQSEMSESIINTVLGTGWDVDSLLDTPTKKPKEKPFTWSFRNKPPKVFVPLLLALTQNPKMLEQLRGMAIDLRNDTREDPSVLNVPKFVHDKKKKIEIVDLSQASKDEFLRYASRAVN